MRVRRCIVLSICFLPVVENAWTFQQCCDALLNNIVVMSSIPALQAPEVSGKDVEISSLRNCTVEIAGQPNALHMRDLKSCKVCIGPVSRSLLLHECTGCEFHIACQQLRIHTSTATDFHIHVTSKAIIEDCRVLDTSTVLFVTSMSSALLVPFKAYVGVLPWLNAVHVNPC
eukprot:m.248229 g.248229  ORF g.248229 m.248229 type:complete len:172 (+) comp19501_c0_seq45:138-653(+)